MTKSVIFCAFGWGRFECEMGWIDEDGNEIEDAPSQDDDEEDDDF